MDFFTKYHLAINKARFKQYFSSEPVADCYEKTDCEFSIVRIPARYGSFRFLLERVGRKWNWTRRPKYYGQDSALRKRLSLPETKLYLLQHKEMTVGYCLASRTTEDPKSVPGLKPSEKLIEIENFGLFPEHTGKKYGRTFLPMIFNCLFAEYETIYLSTRSTNHKGVVPFYQKMGMQLLHQEVLTSDLVPEQQSETLEAA